MVGSPGQRDWELETLMERGGSEAGLGGTTGCGKLADLLALMSINLAIVTL